MRTPIFQLQDLLNAFRKKKVLTKEELLESAQCSAMTAWRLLARHGYYTSYNHNARYYTVVGIPQFDQHGLWNLRKIRFSKWGSLTKTLIALIEDSEAGMTPEQLQELLHVKNVRPALAKLTQEARLAREKIGGRFVYFSLEDSSHRQQRQRHAERTFVLPPLEQIIALLVEIIQRPQNSPRQWANRLARQQIRLSIEDIRAILDHYGMDRKKGLFTF